MKKLAVKKLILISIATGIIVSCAKESDKGNVAAPKPDQVNSKISNQARESLIGQSALFESSMGRASGNKVSKLPSVDILAISQLSGLTSIDKFISIAI